ncbi:MAG: hypothetical protein IH806_03285 [Proteobacteria bacterium]|nr:hypothetical protein [Pseudomonadota bacterium]
MFTPFARAVPWCSGQWCFIVAALVGLRAAFRYRGVRLMAAAGLAGMVAACALPEHMQVRSGIDPRNQDDDVRFRTTYYFRVFDACLEIEPPSDEDLKKVFDETGQPFYSKTRGRYKLLSDSLYRFRMTGKANPLFSAVHFESGTLRASEIEPFGASVAFDEKSRRFRFVSREETEALGRRTLAYDHIERLLGFYKEIRDAGGNGDQQLKASLLSKIEEEITNLVNAMPTSGDYGGPGGPAPSGSLAKLASEVVSEAAKAIKAAKVASAAADRAKTATEKLKNKPDDSTLEKSAKDENLIASVDNIKAMKKNIDAADFIIKRAKSLNMKSVLGDLKAEKIKFGDDIRNKLLNTAMGDLNAIKALQKATTDAAEKNTEAAAKIAAAAATLHAAIFSQLKTGDGDACPTGTVSRKGFQILGPEGWRTFNQDERLLLAMTISGKPLISAMKDLSSRVLNAQPDTTGMLLTLARERIRISEAKSALLGVDKDLIAPREGKQPPTIKEIVDAVTAAFGKGEDGK